MLQFMGLQRVRHNLVTKQQQQNFRVLALLNTFGRVNLSRPTTFKVSHLAASQLLTYLKSTDAAFHLLLSMALLWA